MTEQIRAAKDLLAALTRVPGKVSRSLQRELRDALEAQGRREPLTHAQQEVLRRALDDEREALALMGAVPVARA